jgi:hypothetical protein
MRFGPNDKFWVVVDPKPHSTQGDILFQASLKDLELQFKGGLRIEENPTLFTDQHEAEIEAYGRLLALRAAEAIARRGLDERLPNPTRIEILDRTGKVLFRADLRGEVR